MKRIILLLCVLTLVGILASCARASDKTQEQTKQNEIEVSFEDTKESSDAISPGWIMIQRIMSETSRRSQKRPTFIRLTAMTKTMKKPDTTSFI